MGEEGKAPWEMAPTVFQSEALRVNLEVSSQLSIRWSDGATALLDTLSARPGVGERVLQALRESHHPWPNFEHALDLLRIVAIADYPALHAVAGPDASLTVLFEIVAQLCTPKRIEVLPASITYPMGAAKARRMSSGQRRRLLQTLLELVEIALDLTAAADHDLSARLEPLPALCETVLADDAIAWSRASRDLGTLLAKVALRSPAAPWLWLRDGLAALMRRSLETNLSLWHDIVQAPEPAPRLHLPIAADPQPLFTAARAALVGAADTWEDLEQVPDFRAFVAHFTCAPELAASNQERLQTLLSLLRVSALAHRRQDLLNALSRVFRHVFDRASSAEGIPLVDAVFAGFEALRPQHADAILDGVEQLGRTIVAEGSPELVAHFIARLIAFGFEFPQWRGVSDEWRVISNPAHVHALRSWLAIIAVHPERCARLLAALVLNLRLGGVLLSDADLFHKNVSALLNAPIAPVFRRVIEVCRPLPVFYATVGAEGALRDVSTRLDELSQRKDRLIHFLRKQIHAESNSTHIDLLRDIAAYWVSGDAAALLPQLPEDVRASLDPESPWVRGVRALLTALAAGESVRALLDASPEEQARRWDHYRGQGAGAAAVSALDEGRVELLLELDRLLRIKYGLDAHAAIPQLREAARTSALIVDTEVDALVLALESGDDRAVLGQIFALLSRMRGLVLDAAPTEAREEIHHKRHIAAGIPSVYGRYFEPKLAAMGLGFRLEALARLHFDRLRHRMATPVVNRKSLRDTVALLDLLGEGMALAGLVCEGLQAHIDMLRHSLQTSSFSLAQFVNLFEFMADNVKDLIRTEFLLPYEQDLNTVLHRLRDEGLLQAPEHPGEGEAGQAGERDEARLFHMTAESFYRSLLSEAFFVTELDNLVSETLERLRQVQGQLSPELARQVMSFDLETMMTHIEHSAPGLDNQVFLGSKGFYLKRLSALGYPVPQGFVLSTELFRLRHVVAAWPEMATLLEDLVRQGIAHLEAQSGLKLGNAALPLLLSVRSGAAISMPGAMNTFLNVGINEEVAAGLSRQDNFGWTSWDCYRRFLQTWGMSLGLPRDDFDRIIMDFKKAHGVAEKVEFKPAQMREIALAYRSHLEEQGIELVDEPFAQVMFAIRAVLSSWDTDRAKVYRDRLEIADEWGTAVIVQIMKLGNIGLDSGSGVVFTHDPFVPEAQICLYGDFTTTSQGEDVVAGLVHPWPISLRQRAREPGEGGLALESHFPEIYAELQRIAEELLETHGFPHQEIEFTFESPRREDLFILQTREQFNTGAETLMHFAKVDEERLLGSGIGVSGGAMNGRVAFDMEDLRWLEERYPGEPRILLRPDTVPDDISLIFESEGLLTVRGGAASHAAVTASRLGKTCVVNCRALAVWESEKRALLNGEDLRPGDLLALDGQLGHIYQGHLPLEAERFSPRRALVGSVLRGGRLRDA